MKKIILLLTTAFILFTALNSAWAVTEINMYFPPKWLDNPGAANKITDGLSQKIGITITPQIADCYPAILTALTQKEPVLAYVGSMVQTIVWTRKLGTPLLQAIDHKQNYGGIILAPRGISPSVILRDFPAKIAYAVGTTSGEVCAKAATGGKASIAVLDHQAAVKALINGKAKAAFVKNTWWEEDTNNNPDFIAYTIPTVSGYKNADNVLLVSNFVTPEVKSLIMAAALTAPDLFNADLVSPFDSSSLDFTRELMKKAGIDPLTYSWKQTHSGQCAGKSASKPLQPTVSASQNGHNLAAGEIVMENNCGKCHLTAKVKKYRRKTREQWERTIIKKIGMGVELTEKNQKDLLSYLLSLKQKK